MCGVGTDAIMGRVFWIEELSRGQRDGEGVVAEGAVEGGFVFDAELGVEDGDGLDLVAAEAEEGAEDEAGVGGAEAEVGAEAEGEVGIGFAIEADFVGGGEGGFIEVGGGPSEGDAVAGFDGGAVDFGIDGADAADVGEGHEDAEEFLAGEGDAFGIFAKVFEGFGVLSEMAEGAGDGVDDGVASAGEGEVGETHAFFAGEFPALVGGLGEGAEEVGAGMGFGGVEFLMEVVFEHGAGFELAPGDFEDVDAPTDPGVGFGFGGVEEVGEGAGLDGEGEVVDDLDGRAVEGIGEHAADEGLDLGDHGGVFGALEEGFDDVAIFGVLGGIGFDGELAHGAHVFFGGDGDAEGGVGAEGVPVFGGFANVLVAEDHGDVLAVEGALHDAGVGAGFLEGVGEGGHGGSGLRIADCGGWDVGRLLGGLEALRIKDDDSKTDIGTEAFCSGGGCGFGGDVSTVE